MTSVYHFWKLAVAISLTRLWLNSEYKSLLIKAPAKLINKNELSMERFHRVEFESVNFLAHSSPNHLRSIMSNITLSSYFNVQYLEGKIQIWSLYSLLCCGLTRWGQYVVINPQSMTLSLVQSFQEYTCTHISAKQTWYPPPRTDFGLMFGNGHHQPRFVFTSFELYFHYAVLYTASAVSKVASFQENFQPKYTSKTAQNDLKLAQKFRYREMETHFLLFLSLCCMGNEFTVVHTHFFPVSLIRLFYHGLVQPLSTP